MKLRSSCTHAGIAFETIPAPGAWIAEAACAGERTDLFFPEDDVATELARSICGRCKVRAECIDYAVEIPSLEGIWGGLTRAERTRLKSGRQERAGRSGRCRRSCLSEGTLT